jgi:hypothetical protein
VRSFRLGQTGQSARLTLNMGEIVIELTNC